MAQKATKQICQIPKILELEYHSQQQLNAFIVIHNTEDRVVNYKIKSNHPELYLVKPMEGSIYRNENIRISFKRKSLSKTDFEAYLQNPTSLPQEVFKIQIHYTEQDAIGRQKVVSQEAFMNVRFRNAANKGQQEGGRSKNEKNNISEHKDKQNELKELNTLKLAKVIVELSQKKQLQGLQNLLEAINRQKQTNQSPILLKDIVILVTLAILLGIAL